jgi:hypothetical protein
MFLKKYFAYILMLLLVIPTIFYTNSTFGSNLDFLRLNSIFGKNKDILSFRLNQNLTTYFEQLYNGISNTEIPYFHQGIASDSSYIYFCDKGEGEIEVYDFLGNPIRTIGSVGIESGKFQMLTDICLDESGKIYALDSYKNNIQIFDGYGNYLQEFNLHLKSDQNDPLPLMMTLSNDQNLFVLDSNNGGKIFSKKGKHLGSFVSPIIFLWTAPPFFGYMEQMVMFCTMIQLLYLLEKTIEQGTFVYPFPTLKVIFM